jgi:hypothetical protein
MHFMWRAEKRPRVEDQCGDRQKAGACNEKFGSETKISSSGEFWYRLWHFYGIFVESE